MHQASTATLLTLPWEKSALSFRNQKNSSWGKSWTETPYSCTTKTNRKVPTLRNCNLAETQMGRSPKGPLSNSLASSHLLAKVQSKVINFILLEAGRLKSLRLLNPSKSWFKIWILMMSWETNINTKQMIWTVQMIMPSIWTIKWRWLRASKIRQLNRRSIIVVHIIIRALPNL